MSIHGLERWNLCQIIYEGLDQATRTMVESMCQGGVLNKSEIEAWDFLEELAKKTLQSETTRYESLGSRINTQKGGCHMVADTIYINTRFAALENMLKGFLLSQNPNNFPPPQMVTCSHYHSTDRSLSACPVFAQQLGTGQEQGHVNAAF